MIHQALLDELARLPENVNGELVAGEIHVSARPAKPHRYSAANLGVSLGATFQFGDGGPGGWIFIDEPELHLGEDVLIPDLAGWQLPRDPLVGDEPYFKLAPDWLCEVLSPSTARFDRTRKLAAYAREGVRHVWLLDPIVETLEVYELRDAHWLLLATYAGPEKVRAVPFDAIDLDLARLWIKRA